MPSGGRRCEHDCDCGRALVDRISYRPRAPLTIVGHGMSATYRPGMKLASHTA
jgi:hypothetical protein